MALTYTGSRWASGVKIYIDGEDQKLEILLDDFNSQGAVKREPLRIGAGGGPENRFHGRIQREAWHKYMGRLRGRGLLAYRTVVVGTNDEAVRIAHTLGSPSHGYQTLGLLATGAMAGNLEGLSILGSVDDLSEVIPSRSIECVFVASTAVDAQAM